MKLTKSQYQSFEKELASKSNVWVLNMKDVTNLKYAIYDIDFSIMEFICGVKQGFEDCLKAIGVNRWVDKGGVISFQIRIKNE